MIMTYFFTLNQCYAFDSFRGNRRIDTKYRYLALSSVETMAI